jgi:hypothetical protein
MSKLSYLNKCLLIISDLHIPYHHQDAFKFLKAVKKKYKPDHVYSVGDEADNHGISFHNSDPDLLSPGDELKATQKYCAALYKIFPEMDIAHSNHGSLSYRRAKAGGIPLHFLKDYNDVLEVGEGWKWHEEIFIPMGNGVADVLIKHQFSASVLKSAEQMGMSVIQGHHHNKFEIAYTSSPLSLHYGMTVGCLIDTKALAFEYNKLQVKRPILGVGVIEKGVPKLIPMYLNTEGRWIGKVF